FFSSRRRHTSFSRDWSSDVCSSDLIPYCEAKSWFASTSTFPTTAFPSNSELISSITGPNILHGPHHSAQKSTTTGLSDFKTTSSKVASVISNAIILLFWLFNSTNLQIFSLKNYSL